MKTYELTYIISSANGKEKTDVLAKELEVFVQSKEGVILKSENTQAQTLAYPINKQGSGYFTTLEFQIEEDKIKEIKEKLEKDNQILRHFIMIKKPIKKMKERRTRKPMFIKEFELKQKPSIMESAEKEDQKKRGKVDVVDLDKKLDELLNE